MAKTSKPTRDDARTLSGAERAAVLLLALGDEHGAPIWKSLDDDEVREVSQTMSTLGPISSSQLGSIRVRNDVSAMQSSCDVA